MRGFRFRRWTAGFTAAAVIVLGLGTATPAPAGPVAVVADRVITVAGSLQSELGCPADWQPSCPQSELTKGTGTSYSGTFDVPAGGYELKVTVNGGWDENYGAGGVLRRPQHPAADRGTGRVAVRLRRHQPRAVGQAGQRGWWPVSRRQGAGHAKPATGPDEGAVLLPDGGPVRERRQVERRRRPHRGSADHRPRPDGQGLLPRRRPGRGDAEAGLHQVASVPLLSG